MEVTNDSKSYQIPKISKKAHTEKTECDRARLGAKEWFLTPLQGMSRYPTDAELMTFTNGRPLEKLTDEECNAAYENCMRYIERRELESNWDYLCPPEYQNTIPERLPNRAKFEEVQKWQYGSTGLLLVGPTRSGKTRSIWTLMKRLHFNERRRIMALCPMDLKLQVAAAWRDPETAKDLVWRVRKSDVLFLDDLDTVKFTEAVEETVYDAFEFRPTHGKPVIATLNLTGRELAARMNANARGAKIVERMRESCRVINFR
jgi:DNA replication protein DnaC